MKNWILIIILSLSTIFSATGQKNTIGFACGFAAVQSEDVINMGVLLEKNSIDSIRSCLVSKTPSIRFLAVIILQRLEKRGLIKFSERDKTEIATNYTLEYPVNICNGCVGDDTFKLSKLLLSSIYKGEAEKWADKIIEKSNL